MVPENSNGTAQTRISALIDTRVKAVHDKNIDALLANHAPGISTFDVLNPLRYSGVDAVRDLAPP